MNDTRAAIETLKSCGRYISKQQYKTIKGQILSGNIDAAMSGLETVMKRKGM